MHEQGDPLYRLVETHLFSTCTHRCGYCWFAEAGTVLDQTQIEPYRDPAFIQAITGFFNRRTTLAEKWLLVLTGGEPLVMPNFQGFCDQLFNAGNRVAINTALARISRTHPTYQFLATHGAPEFDYLMCSLHPEDEPFEDEYFDRISEMKAAGHRVFLRFVGHPSRLDKLDHLADKCRDLDVCFYPTTLFSPRFPQGYTADQRRKLASHFSGFSQRIQLEAGVATESLQCLAGSKLISLHLPEGTFARCISTEGTTIGNIFEDRLDLLHHAAFCADPTIACMCDIHFQQDIVNDASDSAQFAAQKQGWVDPIPLDRQAEWLRESNLPLAKGAIHIGEVVDDGKLAFTASEVRAAFAQRQRLLANQSERTIEPLVLAHGTNVVRRIRGLVAGRIPGLARRLPPNDGGST